MKHAIIVEGPTFDWKKAEEIVESSLEMNDGHMSFGAAMMADPGVTKCPKCGEYYWAEARTLRCSDPDCAWEWTIESWRSYQPRRSYRHIDGADRSHDAACDRGWR